MSLPPPATARTQPSVTMPEAWRLRECRDAGNVLAAAAGDGAISPDITGDKPAVMAGCAQMRE
jgi:hypothetical protein